MFRKTPLTRINSLATACRPAILFAGLALAQSTASAEDYLFVSGGTGPDGELVRLGWQHGWDAKWFADGDWYLGGLWELEAGYWRGSQGEDLWDFGLTPVFRLQRHRPFGNGLSPYLEAGIGAHLLSQTRYSDKELSTRFQFGDHLGVGVKFGKDGRFSLTYRYQHHSNGGIKRPNPGVEFHILQLGYRIQ